MFEKACHNNKLALCCERIEFLTGKTLIRVKQRIDIDIHSHTQPE